MLLYLKDNLKDIKKIMLEEMIIFKFIIFNISNFDNI